MNQLISKSQFKAQALEYLRSVEKGKKSLVITHGGKPVAKVVPYKENVQDMLESLRGSVILYKDPTKPVAEDEWEMLK